MFTGGPPTSSPSERRHRQNTWGTRLSTASPDEAIPHVCDTRGLRPCTTPRSRSDHEGAFPNAAREPRSSSLLFHVNAARRGHGQGGTWERALARTNSTYATIFPSAVSNPPPCPPLTQVHSKPTTEARIREALPFKHTRALRSVRSPRHRPLSRHLEFVSTTTLYSHFSGPRHAGMCPPRVLARDRIRFLDSLSCQRHRLYIYFKNPAPTHTHREWGTALPAMRHSEPRLFHCEYAPHGLAGPT